MCCFYMVNNSVMEPLVAEKLPTRYEVAIAIFSLATKPGSAKMTVAREAVLRGSERRTR